jgi:DNA-directed RNA polymerase specialized sigma24 family protein
MGNHFRPEVSCVRRLDSAAKIRGCDAPKRHYIFAMHPALARLTPREGLALFRSPMAAMQWSERHGVPLREVTDVAFDLAEQALDEGPVPNDSRRKDAERLLAFADRAEGLSFRLRQVAYLCLEEGLSLRQAATQIGISRETVRVHLRRLRKIEKEVREREEREGDRRTGFF